MKNFITLSVAILMLFICGNKAKAQFGVTGGNHPELHWNQIETEHFILIYYDGLENAVRQAAPVAEEVYRVVTTNLQTPLPYKVKIYFSDNDEIKNAFAEEDNYIFVWLRGILDDNLFAFRASGTSKWLRSVITHEFTHIVVDYASRDWREIFIPTTKVPRWFNEGLARYMEPDGWTNDLDMALRIAAVSSRLDFDLSDYGGGLLLYEGGQSLVRYIAVTYGDSALVKIIHKQGGSYDFDQQVKAATKHSMSEIYQEWHKLLNVYYNTQFGQKEDIEDIGRKIKSGLDIAGAARLAPDRKRIAIVGKREQDGSTKVYLMDNDTNSESHLLAGDPGILPYLSWSPEGQYVYFSKMRFGEHADLLFDLYRSDSHTGELNRLTTNGKYEQPDHAPNVNQLVAVRANQSGSDLYLLKDNGDSIRNLTNFHDPDVEVYFPRWSPDGSKIAFSIFRKNGMRDIAISDVTTSEITYVTSDSINDRYPVWSPNGDSLVFISFANGIPNAYKTKWNESGSNRSKLHQLTDVASNITVWDWSKDSILVSSFASRTSVQLYWVRASRVAASAPLPSLREKYTSWRSVRFPLVTRPYDSIPSIQIQSASDYNSLAHISPIFFFPIIGSDISRDGLDQSYQLGAFGVFSDPMEKHGLVALAAYGLKSHFISYVFDYTNNQLWPTINAGLSSIMSFAGVIDDKGYFQREDEKWLHIALPFHTPDALNKLHVITVGGEYRNLDPWNANTFAASDPVRRPISARLLDLSITYHFVSPAFVFALAATRADKKLASDLTYMKYRTRFVYAFPLNEEQDFQFALIGKAVVQEGDELPQEFLGFSPYDEFEGGFNFLSFQAGDRLPGIRRYYYGNRLAVGAAELRIPVAGLQLAPFFNIGSVWYGSKPTNNPTVTPISISQTEWLKTAGAELRLNALDLATIGGGVAWELTKTAKPDWYFRYSTTF